MRNQGFKRFYDVRNYLDRIYAINWGGCGISALTMFRWLKKYKGVELGENCYFLYCHSTGSSNLDSNKKAVKNKETGYSCSHVVLYYNGKYYDSSGEARPFINYIERNCFKIYDEQWIVDSLNNLSARWNNVFSRQNVKDIAKKTKVCLNDIRTDIAF